MPLTFPRIACISAASVCPLQQEARGSVEPFTEAFDKYFSLRSFIVNLPDFGESAHQLWYLQFRRCSFAFVDLKRFLTSESLPTHALGPLVFSLYCETFWFRNLKRHLKGKNRKKLGFEVSLVTPKVRI